MSIRNTLFKAWFSQRERAIDRFRRHPAETQERMLRRLLRRGRRTEFGERYGLRHVHTVGQSFPIYSVLSIPGWKCTSFGVQQSLLLALQYLFIEHQIRFGYLLSFF